MNIAKHFIFLHGIGQPTRDWIPTIEFLRGANSMRDGHSHGRLKSGKDSSFSAVQSQFERTLVATPMIGQDIGHVLEMLESSTVGVENELQAVGNATGGGLLSVRGSQRGPRNLFFDLHEPGIHSSDVALDSRVPQMYSQDVTLDSHVLEIHSQDVSLDSCVPEMHSQDVALDSCVPEMHSQDVALDSRVPEMHSQDLALDSHVPEMQSRDRGFNSKTIGVHSQHRAFNSNALEMQAQDERWVIHNLGADYLLFDKEYTLQNLSIRLGQYINRLSGEIHLIGFSMGGILALDYITKHPDKVTSQVLIGARHSLPNWLLTAQDKVLGWVPGRMFMPGEISKENYWTMANSFKDLDTTRKLRSMNHCKTLVAIGSGDYLNRLQSEQLARRIPGAQFYVIPRSGHQVNVDNPRGLATVLQHFYSRIL